jgi:hypothetical protein
MRASQWTTFIMHELSGVRIGNTITPIGNMLSLAKKDPQNVCDEKK